MGWKKSQFISAAFEEIGYADYVFDLEPEQIDKALWRLDAMMSEWNGKGIRLGYPLSDYPKNSSLNTITSVPDFANTAIYKNLAIILAPAAGKMIAQETKAAAKNAFDTLLQRAARPNELTYPDTLPAGQGNKSWRTNKNPFLSPSKDSLDAGSDGEIDFQ